MKNSFTRDTADKLTNLGLGKMYLIKKWLEKYMGDQMYSINDDLTIDVHSVVILDNQQVNDFPEYINFNVADDTFSLTGNNFTTLRGCPKIVNGNFYCNYNKLTTLDYAPEVKEFFICNENEISQETILKSIKNIKYGREFLSDHGRFDSNHILKFKEPVNESFLRNKDKLTSLNIGKVSLIKKWLEKYGIENYIINDNLTIDVNGECYLAELELAANMVVTKSDGEISELPEYINFGKIRGYFSVQDNKLSSTRGFPNEIGGACVFTNNKFSKSTIDNYINDTMIGGMIRTDHYNIK